MIVQMIGIIASQVLLNLPDPTGFALFILPSVLVSLAFMPILLAPTPAPAFDSSRAPVLRPALSHLAPWLRGDAADRRHLLGHVRHGFGLGRAGRG
jgi:hypothetical protein